MAYPIRPDGLLEIYETSGRQMTTPQEHNRQAWDARVRAGGPFHAAGAATRSLRNPLAAVDAAGWLGASIAGRRVLCLAGGGGRQSALYAAAGAQVTVVDISGEMLALDRQVAAERGLELRTVEASMDDLSALAPASFDIVIQPVSTCYVPDVGDVYRQVARVLVAGGLYVSQHKQPASLQAAVEPSPRGYEIDRALLSSAVRCRRSSVARIASRARSSSCIAGKSCWAACAAPASRSKT